MDPQPVRDLESVLERSAVLFFSFSSGLPQSSDSFCIWNQEGLKLVTQLCMRMPELLGWMEPLFGPLWLFLWSCHCLDLHRLCLKELSNLVSNLRGLNCLVQIFQNINFFIFTYFWYFKSLQFRFHFHIERK